LPPPATRQARSVYDVDLGTPGGNIRKGHGVNLEGNAAGWSYGKGSMEFRANGVISSHATLGGTSTAAYAIELTRSSACMIVGEGMHDGDLHAYLLSLR
jgi:hypothetical protein